MTNRDMLGSIKILKREYFKGHLHHIEAIDGVIDWGRVVVVRRDTPNDTAVVVLDSGLEIEVSGHYCEVVDQWRVARRWREEAANPDE